MPELTDKQMRFCEEFLVDLNATQAAIRAGYSKTTASGANKWINGTDPKKPHLKIFIDELKRQRSIRTNISADTVLEELKEIAMSKNVVVTARDKMKALELLGKHLGLFSTGADNTAALEKLDEVLGKIEGGF